MKRIQKAEISQATGPIHKQKALPDNLIRFSFRYFSVSEKFCYPPPGEVQNYLPQLMNRLKAVSDMTVGEFRSNKDRALRAHRHDWVRTSEPDGYAHLNEQLRSCEPWQFCISVNEHGRVHGLLIDSVFYAVWVDPGHALYP